MPGPLVRRPWFLDLDLRQILKDHNTNLFSKQNHDITCSAVIIVTARNKRTLGRSKFGELLHIIQQLPDTLKGNSEIKSESFAFLHSYCICVSLNQKGLFIRSPVQLQISNGSRCLTKNHRLFYSN